MQRNYVAMPRGKREKTSLNTLINKFLHETHTWRFVLLNKLSPPASKDEFMTFFLGCTTNSNLCEEVWERRFELRCLLDRRRKTSTQQRQSMRHHHIITSSNNS